MQKQIHSYNIQGQAYLDHTRVLVVGIEFVHGHFATFVGRVVKHGEHRTLKMQ